ncbi:MAG: thioredoxin domain-containing protein [Propionibacteriaceae bacterium]|jgi:protein-disulfide isomerase|nr:thioredoxin domain-containing protein [Propionibacteriaceae bacterium]
MATNPPSERRKKIEAIEREQKTRRVVMYTIIAVVAVAVLVPIVWLIAANLAPAPEPVSTPTAESTGAAAASGAVSDSLHAAVFGDGKVEVDVFFDFMCPGCGSFESVNSADLMQLVSEGAITLRMHPMNFLDRLSQGTNYSTRAANAFVAIARAEPDKALQFADYLWHNQPGENTEGLSDAEIAAYAQQAGVSQAVIDTFSELANADWITATTAYAWDEAGMESTPGLKVNGEIVAGLLDKPYTIDIMTPGVLKAELEKLNG